MMSATITFVTSIEDHDEHIAEFQQRVGESPSHFDNRVLDYYYSLVNHYGDDHVMSILWDHSHNYDND